MYDVVIAGGGIAGLTAAAYCVRSGCTVLLCEKQKRLGGHVNTFHRSGFSFDQGIRSTENSGVLFPMLRQLGIDLEFLPSRVSLGLGSQMINVHSPESLDDYEKLLKSLYAGYEDDISSIIREIRKIMGYMDILYGIDNPLFSPSLTDPVYLVKTILPWLWKYMRCMPRIAKLNEPVEQYLRRFTDNQGLIDIIAQHFFTSTPTFFALSYFSLYLDYHYPVGGTGAFPAALENYIIRGGGEIAVDTPVTRIDIEKRTIRTGDGREFSYRELIWAADQKLLYSLIDTEQLSGRGVRNKILDRQRLLRDKRGGDSILSVYLAVDLPPSYFSQRSNPHLFYTPKVSGLSEMNGPAPVGEGKQALLAWLRDYLSLTTYEISIPVLRDATLAPEGKTALVISTLFSYDVARDILDSGWYEEFKEFCESQIIEVLTESIYPDLGSSILFQFSSTPVTIERETGNTDGAITGWAFTNTSIPAVRKMGKINSSVKTSISHISQAGQWTYSPSGLPISVLTGKLAADRAATAVKGRRKS
jgi:phytoene dehydrogenase-like protein